LDIQYAWGSARTAADRADDVAGNQVRIFYALPFDRADGQLDLNGAIANSVAKWQNWLSGQTGGRVFRLDRYQGALDIGFVRFELTDAEMRSLGEEHVRDKIEQEMSRMGLISGSKLYAVYYDGISATRCGGGAHPPELVGRVAAMYLFGTQGSTCPRDDLFAPASDPPRYIDYAMIHELVHTLGVVDVDAPEHSFHHVNTCAVETPLCAKDLMYQPRPGTTDPGWPANSATTLILDIYQRNYYNTNGLPANIFNMATSPYLTP
jgi:hypothetical protein